VGKDKALLSRIDSKACHGNARLGIEEIGEAAALATIQLDQENARRLAVKDGLKLPRRDIHAGFFTELQPGFGGEVSRLLGRGRSLQEPLLDEFGAGFVGKAHDSRFEVRGKLVALEQAAEIVLLKGYGRRRSLDLAGPYKNGGAHLSVDRRRKIDDAIGKSDSDAISVEDGILEVNALVDDGDILQLLV